jgi:AcrR family transcriptional regulator
MTFCSWPAVGLRDRKRERTHADLARAAFALARERGLDGFTVDEVAEQAGVSRRTFFNHFQSKEEAVSEVARVQIATALLRGRALLGGPRPELLDDADGAGGAQTGADGDDVALGALRPAMLPLFTPLPSEESDEATHKLHVVVHALLDEESVEVFRELSRLAETHRTLAPHLAAIQVSVVDQAAELLRTGVPTGHTQPVSPVYAHALPGAVAATMWAVYSGQLEVVELGSRSADAVTTAELVAHLRSLIPDALGP